MTETARLAALRAAGAVAVREVGGDVLQLRVPAQRLPPPPAAPRAAAGHAARAGDPRPARRGARRRSTEDDLAPLRAAAAEGRAQFAEAFLAATAADPSSARSRRSCSTGRSVRRCPDGAASAAVLWGAAHRCAQQYPDVGAPGRLRRRGPRAGGARCSTPMLASPSGVTFTVDEYEDDAGAGSAPTDGRSTSPSPSCSTSWRRSRRRRPAATPTSRSCSRPASAARSRPTRSSATRRWRKRDPAARCGCSPGRRGARSASPTASRARLTTQRGSGRGPGRAHRGDAARPHLAAQRARASTTRAEDGAAVVTGVAPNELTAGEDRDRLAGHAVAQARSRPPRGCRMSGAREEAPLSDVDPAALDWLDRYAAAIGVPTPSLEEVTALLMLAGTAATPPTARPPRWPAGSRPGGVVAGRRTDQGERRPELIALACAIGQRNCYYLRSANSPSCPSQPVRTVRRHGSR